MGQLRRLEASLVPYLTYLAPPPPRILAFEQSGSKMKPELAQWLTKRVSLLGKLKDEL